MRIKFKNERLANKKYSLITLAITLYVFLPVFYTSTIKNIPGVLLSVMILFILSKISRTLYTLYSFINLLISAVLLHISFLWGGAQSITSYIEVAALSPHAESLEYLSVYLGFMDIFVVFYVLVGIFILYKFLTKSRHSYSLINKLSVLFLGIVLTLVFIKDDMNIIRPYYYIKAYTEVEDIDKINKRVNYINNLSHQLPAKKPSLNYDKIIIVMGESANKNHMSAYNYHLKTTPFLDSFLKSPQSFKYNAIAPTNQTRYSIPINLTDAVVNNFNLFFTKESIITKFKNYGYKTYWLSNQGKVGKYDNYVTTIANEADYVKIENMHYSDAKYDEILIEYLNKIDINNDSKEVYFLHMMGSHVKYKKRYPEQAALLKNPKNAIDHYDNTIFYTDTILQKIYNKFKDSKLLFIYVSDHAETVSLHRMGHGYSGGFKDEYEIPLIVHSSIKNERLNKLQTLNEKSIFNMESFNKFVEYMVGIDENISTVSTSSNVFSVNPNNIKDFNIMKRNTVK